MDTVVNNTTNTFTSTVTLEITADLTIIENCRHYIYVKFNLPTDLKFLWL